MYVYIYIYICSYVYIYIYICIHTHIYIIHRQILIIIQITTNIYMPAEVAGMRSQSVAGSASLWPAGRAGLSLSLSIYIYIYVCVYIYIYIYT